MKKFLSIVLALIMALSMVSFASAEQGAAVTVGLAGDPGNIGPFQGMGLGRIGILFTTYEMLMVKDGNEFRGCLMKELTQVDDLTYDVEIYDYIKDQAGNPLKASDIKFCFDTFFFTFYFLIFIIIYDNANNKRWKNCSFGYIGYHSISDIDCRLLF